MDGKWEFQAMEKNKVFFSKPVSLIVVWVKVSGHMDKTDFRLQTMVAGWDADTTKALISIWGQESIQSQLDSITRNRVIYEKIAQRLEAEG